MFSLSLGAGLRLARALRAAAGRLPTAGCYTRYYTVTHNTCDPGSVYGATGKTQKYSVSKRHTDAHDTCPVLETSRLDDSITHTHAADGARSLH